jgi:flagellar motor protein MotB
MRRVHRILPIPLACALVLAGFILFTTGRAEALIAKRVWVVFFEPDSAVVTRPQSIDEIRRVAQIAVHQSLHLRIVGYTDTAGAAEYNRRLSERRACLVADILVGVGVPRDWLEVSGSKDQPVPTAEGIPEPQTRRVEITFIDDDRNRLGPSRASDLSGLTCGR